MRPRHGVCSLAPLPPLRPTASLPTQINEAHNLRFDVCISTDLSTLHRASSDAHAGDEDDEGSDLSPLEVVAVRSTAAAREQCTSAITTMGTLDDVGMVGETEKRMDACVILLSQQLALQVRSRNPPAAS